MSGVKDWLRKASGDLKGASKLIKDDDETLDIAAYQTQQSAEKALKTYLVFKKLLVPKTHDLTKLLENCMQSDSTFAVLKEAVEVLFPYAIYTRYPDDRFNIDREEVVEAIRCAEKILKFVKTKVESAEPTPQLGLFEN